MCLTDFCLFDATVVRIEGGALRIQKLLPCEPKEQDCPNQHPNDQESRAVGTILFFVLGELPRQLNRTV